MKRNGLLLSFVFFVFVCHIPIANAADFSWGAVISEYRDYKYPFTASNLYVMIAAANVDTNSYPVYVQNIPGASVDTSLTYMPGWDDLTSYTYARGFVSPPPDGDWENRSYTFYIDMIQNGQKDQGEPTTTWDIPQGSISQMALVQNVSISAGYNPTITWDPAPNADAYRVRFFPVKQDGNPDFNDLLFESDEFSGSPSYSFTYSGTLFNDHGSLAVVIEAWEDYNDFMLNRSRYIVQHDPVENGATFDYGVVISEYRHYEPPFKTSDFYFMLIAAEVDTNNYPVYVQNIPSASVDTSLTYYPGWDDLTPYTYARGFVSPSPGGDWENRPYTFYIDMIQNGQKDQGEPTTKWNIPQGSISQMALVQNVSISDGYNPTITWDPAPNADTYRIRFVPIKDGNPDLSIGLFESDEFSESSSYSFTYTGTLFTDYGPLAVVIEAWEDYNDLTLNRSRYIVKHDPCKKSMPWIPLLLLDD